MSQELPLAGGLVVVRASVAVLGDVCPHQEELAAAGAHMGLRKGAAPRPEALDLGSLEHEPGLDLLEDEVLVPGPAVLGHHHGRVGIRAAHAPILPVERPGMAMRLPHPLSPL